MAPRAIGITPVLNGWVCNIGCQVVVFNDAKLMAKEIVRYYKNPSAVEKEYVVKAVNKMMDNVLQPVNIAEPNPAYTDVARTAPEIARR